MRHLRTDFRSIEVGLYVLCAAAAAIMMQIDFRAGHPPLLFWILVFFCAVGIVRIFMVAWHDDRRAK